jgi:hypothetical protein
MSSDTDNFNTDPSNATNGYQPMVSGDAPTALKDFSGVKVGDNWASMMHKLIEYLDVQRGKMDFQLNKASIEWKDKNHDPDDPNEYSEIESVTVTRSDHGAMNRDENEYDNSDEPGMGALSQADSPDELDKELEKGDVVYLEDGPNGEGLYLMK